MGKVLGLVGVGIVIIGGLWWFVGRPDTSSQMMEEKAMMKEESKSDQALMDGKKDMMPEKKMEGSSEGKMMAQGKYMEYAPGVLEESKMTKRVLFFYASWCPNCRPVDEELRTKMSEIPAGVTVIRVNYSDPSTDQAEKDLAAKYGVTYQHTFVQIDQDGNVVAKWNGGNLAGIVKNIR